MNMSSHHTERSEADANNLIKASSPYLLQHAYNPVDWYEWGEAALFKARAENKLILVSIGYSACHWCHVMERECFENHEVAEVMNQHYVCIKVDREERPDIDQIYMMAVQLMTGSGGWPLNCICLPDQRPVYGGTYFQRKDWINVLLSVANMWAQEPEKAIQYADRLTDGIRTAERIVGEVGQADYTTDDLKAVVDPWKRYFDVAHGGYNRAPKFPLPNNWVFMLRYSRLLEDDATHVATLMTLEKMAMGGIYDHVGGGFARYSVDGEWHVPHFEKMLYDNGQLISLYTEAYQYARDPLFKEVAEETIAWLAREMRSPEGLFYSALDADSEGVEGKFYVWDKSEFTKVLGERQAELLFDYFDVTEEGNWEEEETNVLRKRFTDEEYAPVKGLTVVAFQKEVLEAKAKLLEARSARIRPGLDDKCLTAWNGLAIKGLATAAQVFGNDAHYNMAAEAASFILKTLRAEDGGLCRNYKDGRATIAGFLDDYAFFIDALIALYETDFNEQWLMEAKALADYVLANFSDAEGAMLFYTSAASEALIARKHELMDNVIPSSNSAMAQNLYRLGLFFDEPAYIDKAAEMLAAIHPQIKTYGSAYSNWAIQLLAQVTGMNEIAITGEGTPEVKAELSKEYIPNKIMLGGTNSTLPLLKEKQSADRFETKIYICQNKVCQLPVNTVSEALKFIIK
ncbi:thioredoxin domain-containing protein [Pedobacter deserti]|uniref:thioredoxin domain-containing protein n=1 Tax=Pedobacter deserti TaxID=2817382 RepID=UPI00351F09A3